FSPLRDGIWLGLFRRRLAHGTSRLVQVFEGPTCHSAGARGSTRIPPMIQLPNRPVKGRRAFINSATCLVALSGSLVMERMISIVLHSSETDPIGLLTPLLLSV